jgi:hypothetical protein
MDDYPPNAASAPASPIVISGLLAPWDSAANLRLYIPLHDGRLLVIRWWILQGLLNGRACMLPATPQTAGSNSGLPRCVSVALGGSVDGPNNLGGYHRLQVRANRL